MSDNTITINATIAADTKKAWDYYTQPEHITQWNFAIDTWQCPSASNDMRIGGKYCARMEAKDGSFGFDFEATYNEIEEHKKIVYTIADGRKVQIDFNPVGEQTDVTVMFEAEGQNPKEMQHDGWLAILNNYKKYTESN